MIPEHRPMKEEQAFRQEHDELEQIMQLSFDQ